MSRTKVKSRNDVFVERTASKIWLETPTTDNPYLAQNCACHGYDLLELMQKRSFVDVLYLLFREELPTPEQAMLLEQLMIALINPGPRHPATRAAMTAGVGSTDREHILPIALSVLGGQHLGAGEVEPAMDFLRKQRKHDPHHVVAQLLSQAEAKGEGDYRIAPGFGSRFGDIDPMPKQIAEQLLALPGEHTTLRWGHSFAQALQLHRLGWLTPAIAAAVFTDLGFSPRCGAGLFQLLSAPGLLAHGVELSNKPVTAMPFIKDENYVIET